MKKLFAFLLAVMLMAAMAIVPANAAGSYTIKINSDHAEHSYTAYQIFTGTLDGSVLSNLVWGDGITEAGKTELQSAYSKSDASGVAGTLSDTTVSAFAEKVALHLNEENKKTGSYDSENKQYVIAELEAGYYLIKETSDLGSGSEHAYSKYMLRIVNNVELSPKSGVPTLIKEVKLGETGTYKEAISATVSDTVYFKLTASLHTYVHDYEKCYFRFEDEIPAGLTYAGATVSILSGTQSYTVDASDYSVDTTGSAVKVTIPDIHTAIKSATNASTVISDKIVVEIKTTVNEDVVLGSAGNINTAKLYFSNNPNENYTGTGVPASVGATAPAKAIVYSYQVELTKVDAADASVKLEGAEFIIGYKNGDNTYTWFTANNGVISGTTASEDSAARFTTDSNGVLTIPGLASGTYHIREKTAPAQYNLLTSDIIVQFAGSLSQDSGTLNALTISSASGVSSSSTDLGTGTIRLTVTNTKGAVLPETGGMGTTLFYIVGAALMLGAAAVIVAKKRETK